MKLYLSSFHLGTETEEFQKLLPPNKHAAIIANAKDGYPEESRHERVLQEIHELNQFGVTAEELDLRDYFGKSDELASKLQAFGLVWVLGGNTFILRRAMRQSGFDLWIEQKKHDKDFLYAGYSAGVCVITPTLDGLESVDEPYTVPELYDKDVIWQGLSLIPYSVAPHYQSDHPESEMVEKTVAYFIEHHMPFKTLRDGEVIIETIH